MKDRQQASRRLIFLRVVVILIFIILISRLGYLQIYKSSRFKKMSEGYRTSIIPISAPRGKIHDREGKVLVANKLTYSVSVIPAKAKKLQQVLVKVAAILDLEISKLKEKVEDPTADKPVIIERNISQKELIRLEEAKSELAGVIIGKTPVREYVYDNLASHAVGYVGEISASKLKRIEKKGYKSGDLVGKTGLELIYEKYLRGKKGKKLIEVNNQGQKVKTLATQEPVPGYDLILNLDYKIQKKAEKLLEEKIEELTKKAKEDEEISKIPKGGAVIAADPEDSSILALASFPDYDSNQFITGISQKKWEQLTESYRQPLLNRAVNTSVPPGSIFKIVTGVASMEELGVTAETEFSDPGYYKTGGVKFENWYPGGQGEINFVDGIAWSNNTVFFKLGHKLYKKDKDLLQEYAREFGLGQKTKIDLNNESSGLVPGPEWRKEKFTDKKDQIWYPGYTINLSIGQGNLQTSPMQLLNLVSGVANGGKLYQPLLVDKIVNSEGKIIKELEPDLLNEIPVAEETLELMKEGLKGVTSYGTARKAFEDFPMEVAGKTGTAQTGRDRPNHAWFAGFAPVKDPEIAVVIFIEYGQSSSNTLLVAKEMLADYFDIDLSDEQTQDDAVEQPANIDARSETSDNNQTDQTN